MSFDNPWLLWLLPLALLPLLCPAAPLLRNGWLAYAPRDRASELLGWLLRACSVLALVALVLAMAGPYRPEYSVDRMGRGAEIVLVLDRSRSMDDGFAPGTIAPAAARGTGPEALEYYTHLNASRSRESKGQVARALLSRFVAQRPDDRFALIVFSTLPMRVLGFTQKPEMIQAAIAAGNIGRGLAETHIGPALEAALDFYQDRPYTGSRLVMLVSDGGDRLDADTRTHLARRLRQLHVGINWLYLRSTNGPTLQAQASDAPEAEDSVPELLLNHWLSSLDTPYRAYEASDTLALQRAIDDVNRLEKLPINYPELIPRRELAPWCHGMALCAVLILLGARWAELRQWS